MPRTPGELAASYANLLAEMRFQPALRITSFAIVAAIASAQKPVNENPGMPARATPADYQAWAKAGNFTIAAEFTGHSIPTAQGPLTSEDYVAVEIGVFGPADEKLKLAAEDFTLRINAKKVPTPNSPFGVVGRAVKDPDYEPPVSAASEKKSKTSLGSSGGSGAAPGEPPPSPPPIPFEVRRAMAIRVQKSALPEGERVLPQAGVLFFQYRGKAESIHSLELLYTGSAGKATVILQR